MAPPPLTLITALARSGSLDRAWSLFEAGGYATANEDAAALAVKGRLLKDRGLCASGEDRRRIFDEAQQAYKAADALTPAPYLLINVATLACLAGDVGKSTELAREVLQRLDAGGEIAETPYWLAATRAEALLLQGEATAADTALAQALAHAPDNWSDHASTLRQLRLILEETRGDINWLNKYRPPKSLHFAGHLGVAGDDAVELRAMVDQWITHEHIGFGYGALAAGADIIIAEALLERGGDLHAVLPVPSEVYLRQSVSLIGGDWIDRFHACLDAATSITEATQIDGEFEPLSVALAGDISMGSAVLCARMLETSACQLVVADEGEGQYGSGRYTARDAERWASRGLAQHVLRCPRSEGVRASGSRGPENPVPSRRLAAVIQIMLDTHALKEAEWLALADAFEKCEAAFANSLLFKSGIVGRRIYAFDDVDSASAAAAAAAAISTERPTISGHYGIFHSAGDGSLFGPAMTLLDAISTRAYPGSFTVSEPFAAAFAFKSSSEVRAELIGDEPIKLYALKH